MESAVSHSSDNRVCQSCGMPMPEAGLLGSERDGGASEDYCLYCYENGEFKQPEITLEAMMDECVGYMVQEGMEEGTARKILSDSLPYLKRWRTAAS